MMVAQIRVGAVQMRIRIQIRQLVEIPGLGNSRDGDSEGEACVEENPRFPVW